MHRFITIVFPFYQCYRRIINNTNTLCNIYNSIENSYTAVDSFASLKDSTAMAVNFSPGAEAEATRSFCLTSRCAFSIVSLRYCRPQYLGNNYLKSPTNVRIYKYSKVDATTEKYYARRHLV